MKSWIAPTAILAVLLAAGVLKLSTYVVEEGKQAVITQFGKPVRFVPPSYALDDITKIPRFRSDDRAQVLHEAIDNYQTRNTIHLESPVETNSLRIAVDPPSRDTPAALFEVRCYVSRTR